MSHLLLRRLHLRSRVATLPAIKDVETETIPHHRAPIGRRNSLRAMQPLLRHGSHIPMPRQFHRPGRPATITGQQRASPSPGRQHRNGRKHRRRTATQALDMPRLQRGNPRRLRRTRRTRASQRTTNTRQLLQSKWEGEPEDSPDFLSQGRSGLFRDMSTTSIGAPTCRTDQSADQCAKGGGDSRGQQGRFSGKREILGHLRGSSDRS
jgi:hypothetical protein